MANDEPPQSSLDVSVPETESVQPTSHSGSTWKVLGAIDDADGVGVLGHATPTSGAGKGVHGVTDSPAFGVGVEGTATADSGQTYGVRGMTASVDADATGVMGRATGSSGKTYGVWGITDSNSDSTAGVYGEATHPAGGTYGVQGVTNASAADAAGIRGTVANTDGNAAAIRAEGRVDVDEVGCEASLSTDQTISGGLSVEIVRFTDVHTDHFESFNVPSNGRFTVPAPGDYHVSTSLSWGEQLPAGTFHLPAIYVNGSVVAQRRRQSAGYISSDTLSKTLFGLSSGDVVDVRVAQGDSTTHTIVAHRTISYVTIHKVG